MLLTCKYLGYEHYDCLLLSPSLKLRDVQVCETPIKKFEIRTTTAASMSVDAIILAGWILHSLPKPKKRNYVRLNE